MTADSEYGVGLFCENGHSIDSRIDQHPGVYADFCRDCGAGTLMKCPKCEAPIRGYHPYKSMRTPMYCHSCGAPYPWTFSKLEAAREIAEEAEELSSEERALLAKSFPDLISDTPRTDVAAVRVRKILSKVGGGAAEALRKIAVDIGSEAAKKIITGG